MIKKNYQPSRDSVNAYLNMWRKSFRQNERYMTCSLTGDSTLTTVDTGIGVALSADIRNITVIALRQEIALRLRQYIQSAQTPLVLDIESCTDPNFQFIVAYTLVYSSRGYDFYNMAQRAINVEQLARQYRIIWTQDWRSDRIVFDDRVCDTFGVDYLEMAKMWWILAGRAEPTKRLIYYAYENRSLNGNGEIHHNIFNESILDDVLTDDQRPRYRTHGELLATTTFAKRITECKFLKIPDGNLDDWLRSLPSQYPNIPRRSYLHSEIGLQEYKPTFGRFVFSSETEYLGDV